MKRKHILYNPLSGREFQKKIELLKDIYKDSELNFVDVRTINLKEFFNLNLNEDIVICGGDGTLNKFVNLLDSEEFTNNIYYYPTGSGNDFYKDVCPKGSNKPILINDYLKDLPVVEVNGKQYKFINGVGFGIDGYCCEVGDKLKETSTKPVNYTSIAIKGLLFHYKTTNATVIVDGVKHEFKNVWLAPSMIGKYYGGGMIPTPNQTRDNKETLSVLLFMGKSKLNTLMIFPSIFKGEHVKKTKNTKVLSGKEITVIFDKPRSLQIDGETILNVLEYTVRRHN